MKNIMIISLLCVMGLSFNGCSLVEEFSSGSPKEIKWVSIEKVAAKNNLNKMIVVDLYTSWCGWCKRMDKSTFQDPKIIKYVNKHFYPVKFNAEERKAIEYQGKTFVFDSNVTSRGRHQLATELLQTNEKVGYPTLVFLDSEMNIIQAVQGFKDAEEFEVMITYFAGEHYKTTPWMEYRRNYQPM